MAPASTCPICLGPCFLPVQVTCFPCVRTNEGVHCHLYVRFCFACAVQYFQMEKPIEERKKVLRCLYCEEIIDPTTVVEPFQIDYTTLNNDPDHHRFCGFCDWIAPDPSALLQHCWETCDQFPKFQCGDCNAVYSKDHECNACPICHHHVETEKWFCHVREVHGYDYCFICEHFTTLPLEDHHREECSQRVIQCTHCSMDVQAIHFTDHLMDHLHESKRRCRLLQDLLHQETHVSRQLLEEAQDFFHSQFSEPPMTE